jgi:hypothetical protein
VRRVKRNKHVRNECFSLYASHINKCEFWFSLRKKPDQTKQKEKNKTSELTKSNQNQNWKILRHEIFRTTKKTKKGSEKSRTST